MTLEAWPDFIKMMKDGEEDSVTTQEEYSLIYSQEAADRILDRSTRQRDMGTSHVTSETNQGALAAACIYTNK